MSSRQRLAKRLAEKEFMQVGNGFSLQVEQKIRRIFFADAHIIGIGVCFEGVEKKERLQIGDCFEPCEGPMELIDRADGNFDHSGSFLP